MKINAKIDILFSETGLDIRIHDTGAAITFVDLHLNKKQTCSALSRLCRCEVEKCEVFHLDSIGKILETSLLTFVMPTCEFKDRHAVAYETAKNLCKNGWVPDNYFGSKDSFHTDENGVTTAIVTVRRWK